MGRHKDDKGNVHGRWANNGRFASKKDIAEQQQQHDEHAAAAATATAAEDDVGGEAAPPLHILLCERPVNVPRKARTALLDPRATAKLARADRDYQSERKRSATLHARLNVVEMQLAEAKAEAQSNAEKGKDELKELRDGKNNELRLVKLPLRTAQHACGAAKAAAAKLAAEAGQRVRDRAATAKEVASKKHQNLMSKQREEAKRASEAARALADQEIAKRLASDKQIHDLHKQLHRESTTKEQGILTATEAASRRREAEVVAKRTAKKLKDAEALITKLKLQADKNVMKLQETFEAKQKEQTAKWRKKVNDVKAKRAVVVKPRQAKLSYIPAKGGDITDQRRRYDYIRNQSINLRNWCITGWDGGCTGETALEVFTYFFDHHQAFATRLFIQLGLPQEIERQVVSAHESWFSAEKAVALRNQTGMTWDGYRHLAGTMFCDRDAVTGKYLPIAMPFGGSPVRLPRTWRLIQKEKEIFLEFGLSESDDGITAWLEIIPLLELRIGAIPVEYQPTRDGTPLKIFFGADSFRLYTQNSIKATLCVCKAMISRHDAEGHRLQGWAINSAMNNVKMAIYEGGDSYLELCTKGSQVQKQLEKLQTSGLSLNGEKMAIRLGLFGDMSFINNILGSGGCATNNCCPHCDCHKDKLLWTRQEFIDAGVPFPRAMTIKRHSMLAHAFGKEYGLEVPYVCEGCNREISEHNQYAPDNAAQYS